MQWLIALGIGMSAGLHTSTWGMYKDAPHEGFGQLRYFRSTIVSTCVALFMYPFTGFDMTQPKNMALLWGMVYVVERALVEFYKGFVREEDQSKYFIPMQFAVNGKVVKNRKKRLAIGFVYAAVVCAIAGGVLALDLMDVSLHPVVVVLIGSIGGWISAFGGAWKDAPIEGFETFKFFRSPSVAAFYAFVLSHYTDSLMLITFPALGYCIASIETYKTFCFPNVPRGKFAGKPIEFPEMLERRKKYVPVFFGVWIFVIAFNALALINAYS